MWPFCIRDPGGLTYATLPDPLRHDGHRPNAGAEISRAFLAIWWTWPCGPFASVPFGPPEFGVGRALFRILSRATPVFVAVFFMPFRPLREARVMAKPVRVFVRLELFTEDSVFVQIMRDYD